MSIRGKIIIIVTGALLLAVVIVILLQNRSRYNWYETYDVKSKHPYGTFVISEMLKDQNPGKKFTVLDKSFDETLKKNEGDKKVNYVFIGNWLRYDSSEVNSLLSFVSHGNAAFISTTYNSAELLSRLFPDTCAYTEGNYYTTSDSFASFNFFAPSLSREDSYYFKYAFRNEQYAYSWSYFDSSFFCGTNDKAMALGYMGDGYFNFIKIKYGSGEFYLHSTPLTFSNYSLTKSDNLDYASKVFSYLSPGDILWDEYNKMPGDLNFNSRLSMSQSPLQFILSQESLRWAWYILLLLVLLYIIFFGKRRQRIIPIIEPNVNTSLEYIHTIGQLYYQEQSHQVLCVHKMKLFQAFIRNRYFINPGQMDEDIIKKISVKSQVPLEDIQIIFTKYQWIDRNINITKEMLIEFHQLIENFYKKCK